MCTVTGGPATIQLSFVFCLLPFRASVFSVCANGESLLINLDQCVSR